MALIVEDGTGLSNSETYVSVNDATTLLAEVGVTDDWTSLAIEVQEGRLRRATSTMDNQMFWYGELLVNTNSAIQALGFPRFGLVDTDNRVILGVPRNIKESCAELAYALGTQDIIADASGRNANSVKVGPVEVQISSAAKLKKLIPDSVLQKLTLYGRYKFQGRGMRKLAW